MKESRLYGEILDHTVLRRAAIETIIRVPYSYSTRVTGKVSVVLCCMYLSFWRLDYMHACNISDGILQWG